MVNVSNPLDHVTHDVELKIHPGEAGCLRFVHVCMRSSCCTAGARDRAPPFSTWLKAATPGSCCRRGADPYCEKDRREHCQWFYFRVSNCRDETLNVSRRTWHAACYMLHAGVLHISMFAPAACRLAERRNCLPFALWPCRRCASPMRESAPTPRPGRATRCAPRMTSALCALGVPGLLCMLGPFAACSWLVRRHRRALPAHLRTARPSRSALRPTFAGSTGSACPRLTRAAC